MGSHNGPDWQNHQDDILIAAHLRGDENAFQVIFEKYRDMVARIAFSMVKDPSLVDDIVQEVFISIYRNIAKFRKNAEFKTWVYRIAVNEANRHRIRAKRWVNYSWDFEESGNPLSTLLMFDLGESPERVMIESQRRAVINASLDTLKSSHRLVLTLYYLEELSVREIGEILEMPAGSVKSRLFYAREALKKKLEPLLGSLILDLEESHVL